MPLDAILQAVDACGWNGAYGWSPQQDLTRRRGQFALPSCRMSREAAVDLELIDAAAGGMGPADVILVFGSLHTNAADKAARAYHDGLAPWVLVTGGESRARAGHLEADRLRQALRSQGVPERNIIVEPAATSTVENVAFSIPLLRERVGEVRRVIAVVKWFHRRAVVLLAAGMPDVERIFAADYEPFDAETGKHLLRRTWEESSPISCRNETAYMRAMAAAGMDLLERNGQGWVRTGSSEGDRMARSHA